MLCQPLKVCFSEKSDLSLQKKEMKNIDDIFSHFVTVHEYVRHTDTTGTVA